MLLEICLTTTYFQFEDKLYQQKEGMAMGNSLSLEVNNIFMEHFEETALDTADYKPAKWLRYVDDHSWYGHMDQQSYINFFTISTSLSLPSNSLWKVRLMIPFHSWMFWL
jgi:hypothetical protein